MCISDIEANAKKAIKTAFVYLLVSLFCVLFGAVYEMFSYEVYSFYMIYAFAFPLAGGTLPFFVLSLIRVKKYPNALARNLYHSGIAALTVGSIIRGVLDIYGTTNVLTEYYRNVGFSFVLSGILVFVVTAIIERVKERTKPS